MAVAEKENSKRPTRHKEVETWKGHHVDGQFSQVSVQLPWKPQTRGHTRHGGRNEVVQISVSGRGKLQYAEANVIESLVVDAKSLVGVLDQLMHGERGVVWFNDSVRNLQNKMFTAFLVLRIQRYNVCSRRMYIMQLLCITFTRRMFFVDQFLTC